MYMFLNFSSQWNSIGQRNQCWKAALELGAWISLHFRSSRFQTKQGAWHKRIKLMKVSDFPSTRTTNSVRLILGSQKGNNFTRTALRESHQTTSFALRPETSSRCNMIPRRTKFKGRDHGYVHARRLSLQNKFVRSTLNSKSPLLMESLKILRFIPTSAALAGLVILR